MRINPNARTPDIAEKRSERVGSPAQRSAAETMRPSQDRDPISVQSKVHSLAAQVQQAPEVRATRVAALASAIRDGSYAVGSDQIADSLFSEMQARVSRGR